MFLNQRPFSFRSAIAAARLSLPLLCAMFGAACGGCSGGPSVDGGPAVDGGTGAAACRAITFGDVGLDVQFDVETVYSAPLQTGLGSDALDFLVFNFVNYNERFGPGAVGTFSLSEPPNDNRGTCPECVSVFVDQLTESSEPDQVFFQSAGSIALETDPRSGIFRGRVVGLELVEVTIDGLTLESTPVPGGECLRVEDFDVDYAYVPDEWTCDPALYASGGVCNCDCGAYDPDCFCDGLANPDCPAEIEDDCGDGTVCTVEGCKASCDIFADPPLPCAAGELCAFDTAGQVCVSAPGRVNAAALGETCAGDSVMVQYCDVENTLPKGVCDDLDGTCRPVCFGMDLCPAEETCFTIAGGGPENGGMGYCRPAEDDNGGGGGGGAPTGWECSAEQYGDGFICECGCGVPDPDCDDPANEVLGCGAGATCVDGACQ